MSLEKAVSNGNGVTPNMLRIKEYEYAGVAQTLANSGDVDGARGALYKFAELQPNYEAIKPALDAATTSERGIRDAARNYGKLRGDAVNNSTVLDFLNYMTRLSDGSKLWNFNESKNRLLMVRMRSIKDMKIKDLRKMISEAYKLIDEEEKNPNAPENKLEEAYMVLDRYSVLMNEIDNAIKFNDVILTQRAREKTIQDVAKNSGRSLIGLNPVEE